MKLMKTDKKGQILIRIGLVFTFFLVGGIVLLAIISDDRYALIVSVIVLLIFVMILLFLIFKMEKRKDIINKSIARVSHEIRTPISAILGISEIELQRSDLHSRTEESFAKIHDSASILLRIVNDILDLSKIEAGKMSVRKEVYEIPSLVNDVSLLHLVYRGNKQIDFKLLLDKELPERLLGDVLRIKQIINNLLSNAFKYTEAGMVILEIQLVTHSHQLDFANTNDATLVIKVKDTGLGMTKEQMEKLSHEYSRFHERQSTGTGLGMPIVYSLVKIMNATIDILSKPRHGTTVTVRIPQSRVDDYILDSNVVESLERFEFRPYIGAKKFNFSESLPQGRVLVVDDIDTNLYVIRGLLMFYDLEIETCISGRKAIEKVTEGNVYDIIFMDQVMPEMDGTQTMQILRDNGYKYPIVVLTADALVGHAEKFLKQGFNDFISKPINSSHLNTILLKYIKNKDDDEANKIDSNRFLTCPEVIKKLRSDFARTQSNTVINIKGAIEESDITTAHRLTHNLKSLSALIDEYRLAELARRLEIKLHDEKISVSGVTDMLDELGSELTRVLQTIAVQH